MKTSLVQFYNTLSEEGKRQLCSELALATKSAAGTVYFWVKRSVTCPPIKLDAVKSYIKRYYGVTITSQFVGVDEEGGEI